jgi:hypothetical protein
MSPLAQFLIIANIQTVLTLIGIILILTRYKAKQSDIKLLGIYLIASFVGSVTALIAPMFGVSSNYVSVALNFIDLPLIVFVFIKATCKRPRTIDLIVITGYCAFVAVNTLFIQRDAINSYTFVLKSIIVIIYSLHYFYWLLRELPTTDLHSLPMFWINSALIIYFSGNLFLFVFTSYLVHVLNNDLSIYWTLHNILAAIEVLMIVIALWLDLRNTRSLSL